MEVAGAVGVKGDEGGKEMGAKFGRVLMLWCKENSAPDEVEAVILSHAGVEFEEDFETGAFLLGWDAEAEAWAVGSAA